MSSWPAVPPAAPLQRKLGGEAAAALFFCRLAAVTMRGVNHDEAALVAGGQLNRRANTPASPATRL